MKTWSEVKRERSALAKRRIAMLSGASKEQYAPVANNEPAVWPLVIEDMKARDVVGRERYGVPLQPHNGRDALRDAYEEALDLCAYLKQAMMEREGVPELQSRTIERLLGDLERVAMERDEAREQARLLRAAVAMAEAHRDAAVSGKEICSAYQAGAFAMRKLAANAAYGVSRVSSATAHRVCDAVVALPLPELPMEDA